MLSPGPLLASDPVKIGSFWLDSRLAQEDAGIIFLGHDNHNREVMLIVLTEGAALDRVARDRFCSEINRLHDSTVIARGGEGQDSGRLAHLFDDNPSSPGDSPFSLIAPWAALQYDGSKDAHREAVRILHAVDLSASIDSSLITTGPDFHLEWKDRKDILPWRLWPLPWPGRHERAGILPIFASWMLTILICGLGLLIAVLIFQNAPPQSARPPIPTTVTTIISSTSSSPDASSSESGISPSPQDSTDPSSEGSPSSTSSMPTQRNSRL